ncbi:MAG: DUF6807 family protein [Roseibacillus sp.]
MKTNTLALTLTLSIGLLAPLAAQLEIKDTKGKHLDILSGDKVLVRYMYEHDISTDEKKHATYKPYLHVFDAAGKVAITKGPGGQYTHHRGIFIGWSKLGFNGKSYDRWHMKDGAIVHQKFHEHKTRGNTASITSVTQWNDGGKKPILDEERTMTVWTPEEGWARVVIFFKSKLTATYGDVALKGDPEHAGIQYRPADEVNRKKTRYLFPKEEITAGNVKKHKDLAWIAETCWLGDKAHSVVQLNHPGNPKGTVHSAYRDYGRFGSFFEKDIKKGETLTVNYAFAIVDGELPSRSEIQEASDMYAEMKERKE